MSKISDEKTKLLANTLDRASTTCLALGVVAPIATAFYEVEADRFGGRPALIFSILIRLGVAVGLHIVARLILTLPPKCTRS